MRAGVKGFLRAGGLVVSGFLLVVALMLVLGNGSAEPVQETTLTPLACTIEAAGARLPARVRETSGLARSAGDPAMFWTHNDSGDEPVLYAIGARGEIAAAVRVEGATARDWEDLEAGPCPEGDGPCLFIADTGDNDAQRDHVTVYVVPEPTTGQVSVPATPLRARYPEGPRDAEGLFLANGRLHLVTKGREGPIRLYRYPANTAPDGIATLEPVSEIAPQPGITADYVTAATASEDGRWVALRTYRTLILHEAAPLLDGAPGTPRTFDLAPLGEAQGESVVLGDSGQVWLTSEGAGADPSWSRLICELPEGS